ncbi:MAG: hypothetical protein CSA26_09850 [Desulfobacterales bacterium]|nr:MAG: hypothetical protein CSA26_09850 [Desulfobacterales bacterium]
MKTNDSSSFSETLPLLVIREGKEQRVEKSKTSIKEYFYSDRDAIELKNAVSGGSTIVIALQEKASCYDLLKKIRSDPETALKPVFLTTVHEGEKLPFSDGTVSSIQEASEKAMPIVRRLERIDRETSDSQERIFLLLGYLYSRPKQSLMPFADWQSKEVYHYPLADVLLGDDEESFRQLQSLCDHGLIREERLVDRIRHCPHCNGCHLNFVDTCPQCESINIHQQQFFHCFTCGHVDTEESFLDSAGLYCPNCQTKLRHIGADYDRALENYLCHDCKTSFSEAGVLARCHHCSKSAKPEELVPQNIHSFQLTEQGRLAARTGSLGNVYAVLDALENITPSYFYHFLDWALQLSKRYPEDPFSVIGIRLSNIMEITDTLGRQRAWELMDEFVIRIRAIVRSTDLTCRTSQQDLWLLLSRTPKAGCSILQQRIQEIKELTRQPDGVGLEFATITCTIPEEVDEKENAKLLIARLKGALS